VESNWHLVELCRYIVLNPVRAGLCLHPGEWRWSSYRATIGVARRPALLTVDWLLSQFGRRRPQARTSYRGFVEGTLRRGRPP
jgi:hypothetical protein